MLTLLKFLEQPLRTLDGNLLEDAYGELCEVEDDEAKTGVLGLFRGYGLQ